MNDIKAEQNRNVQPRFFHGDPLVGIDLVRIDYVE